MYKIIKTHVYRTSSLKRKGEKETSFSVLNEMTDLARRYGAFGHGECEVLFGNLIIIKLFLKVGGPKAA